MDFGSDTDKQLVCYRLENKSDFLFEIPLLTPTYISNLIDKMIQSRDLNHICVTQLNNIQWLLHLHKADILANRINIKDNLVYIDGYALPIDKEEMTSINNINNESYKRWEQAKTFLNFVADITKQKFIPPSEWGPSVDTSKFFQQVNVPENKIIIADFWEMLWFSYHVFSIPLYEDRDWYLVHLSIWPDYDEFWYHKMLVTRPYDKNRFMKIKLDNTLQMREIPYKYMPN